MAKRGRKPGTPKTGGRQKGTPNKVGASLREAARLYTDEALALFVEMMRAESVFPQVRLAAARELMDRGYGRPAQAITGEDGGPIAVATTVVHEHHPS